MTHYQTENWWTSPFNEEYRQTLALPEHVQIHDATLRDGEQTPGVVFTPEDKLKIARIPANMGVERIEAGMPAVSEADKEAIKSIVKDNLPAKIFTFARAMVKDIEMATECGAHGVVIEVPIGKPKLLYQFGWTWEDVAKKTKEAVEASKDAGLYTVLFPYDTTRADWEDLKNLLGSVCDYCAPDSVGVVDTTGCILPGAMFQLVRRVKNLTGLSVEVHTHNDFGMALANSLAAVEGGADVIHTCLNSLGERTGNTSLFQLLMALKVMFNMDYGTDFGAFKKIADEISAMCNVPLAGNEPIIGDRIFTRESGIGIEMLREKPLAMFSLNPEFVGNEPQIVLGKKSGVKSVEVNLEKLGIKATEDQMRNILAEVKDFGIKNRRLLTDEEFKAIASKELQ
ncbi:MAG TPA: 2-isopropylmalate synthase [Aminobacterium sp.]|nr:2-isopropylmalate synthase [Aminobacterium sp.]